MFDHHLIQKGDFHHHRGVREGLQETHDSARPRTAQKPGDTPFEIRQNKRIRKEEQRVQLTPPKQPDQKPATPGIRPAQPGDKKSPFMKAMTAGSSTSTGSNMMHTVADGTQKCCKDVDKARTDAVKRRPERMSTTSRHEGAGYPDRSLPNASPHEMHEMRKSMETIIKGLVSLCKSLDNDISKGIGRESSVHARRSDFTPTERHTTQERQSFNAEARPQSHGTFTSSVAHQRAHRFESHRG